MENLSHSRRPNRPVPKKACNGGSGFGSGPSKAALTTTYNEFFGGPARFGASTLSPCLEDYCEIFGGVNVSSRATVSSVPVLDLPLVDDRDVYFDVRSPGFDYREVFGGFDDFDFAPSYEELLMERSETGEDDSSDEAWIPAEMESISRGTEHAGKSPCFTNGRDSYESIDGSTEFNISYNETHQISYSNMFSEVTHVSGLGAVPGYTFEIDEMAYAEEITKLKKKPQSFLVRGDTSVYSFGSDERTQKHYSRAASFPSKAFVTVSDINLKTKPSEVPPPSRPPPLLKRDSSSSASNCRTTVSEGSADGNSPPFFDAEVDTCSAAVKKVMGKAQARLNSAKEVLEGKKDGAQITVQPSPANERTTEEVKLGLGNMNLPVGWPEVEKNNNASRKSSEDKHGRISLPVQGFAKFDGDDDWKEATQFFELVRTEDPRNSDESSSGSDISLHHTAEFPEQKQKWATKGVVEKQKERRAKGDRGKHEVEKLSKNYGATEIAYISESYEKKRLAEKVLQEGMEEKLRNVVMHVEAENKLPDRGGSEKHEILLKSDREGNGLLVDKHAKQKKELHCEETSNHIENEELDRLKPHLRRAVEKEQEYLFDWEQSARELREVLGLADNESMLEVFLEPNEDGKESRMAEGMDVNEKKLKEETLECIEDVNRMKESREKEKKESTLRDARQREENEHRMIEVLEKAEQEKRTKEQEEEQRLKDAFEKEEKNRRMKEAREKAEQERKFKLGCEKEEHERKVKESHEKEELERRQKEALEQEQKERHLEEVQEREESERRAKEALENAGREKRLKQEQEENKKLKEAMELAERERNMREACERAESDKRLEEAQEQEEMARRRIDAKEREKSENEEKQHDFTGQEDKERLEEAPVWGEDNKSQREACGREKPSENTEEASGKESLQESLGETTPGDEEGDSHETLYKVPAEEDEARQIETRDRPDGTCPRKVFEKKLKDANRKEGLEENVGEKHKAAAEEERVRNMAADGVCHDQRDMEESRYTSRMSSDLGNNENKFDHQQEERGSSYHTLAGLNQDVNLEKPLPSRVTRDFVDTTRKEAVQNNASQTTGNKSQDPNEILAQHEKEAERIKRERELQMEQLRKIEEEREKEKDGMAFDHRALDSARERLEKACTEAKEKSLAFFGASRYQDPSACAGTDGESSRRYISRLERHRRTADRVAKALEEKNMRDLVAQREQSERNRLAETLDAEVKRWSSGKEGNIRALLSTLQYILGHESGWQPIPLTEVITSAAVKKAYRKATLCVHPDKLQQRGANIQQKYISEKVFDLLKEAWNRFNSEER